MNQRIKLLAEQANEAFSQQVGEPGSYYFNGFAKKFAELIVRESVGIADDYVKDCTCDEHKNCKHPRIAIGRKIGEHFGVKE